MRRRGCSHDAQQDLRRDRRGITGNMIMQPVVTAQIPQRQQARHNQVARPCASRAERLEQRLRDQIRYEGKSDSTADAYWHWSRQFILWSGKRHPQDMGQPEVEQFLNWLVNSRDCSSSTHSQALNAIRYLYRRVIGVDMPWLNDLTQPKKTRRLPVVLTEAEVRRLLPHFHGVNGLVLKLLYGTGI